MPDFGNPGVINEIDDLETENKELMALLEAQTSQ